MSEPQRRRPADAWREAKASAWMGEGVSAEEWAARNAHDIVSFSFNDFEYTDPVLDRWVQELGRILFTPGAVAAARRRHLSMAEIGAAEEREREPI